LCSQDLRSQFVFNYGMAAKKTTLMLEDDLYAEIRQRAAKRGSSVSSLVSEALREYLARAEERSGRRISLTTAEGGGWIGPADPRSNSELFDAMTGATILRSRANRNAPPPRCTPLLAGAGFFVADRRRQDGETVSSPAR
jgi:plasmid stability protein